jgi:hypothetical protein
MIGHLLRHEGILKTIIEGKIWFREAGQKTSSSLCVQTSSGVHPAYCTMDTGGSLPGNKARPVREADHSPPSSTEVDNE